MSQSCVWGFELQVNDNGNVTCRLFEDPVNPIEFEITEGDARRILHLFEMKRIKEGSKPDATE